MKRLISVALILVMVLTVFTACGKLEAPIGVYADGTGTNSIEFVDYNADENIGHYKTTSTLSDVVVEGTFTVSENDPKAPSYILTFSIEGSEEVVEYVFDKTMDVVQNISDGIAYFGPNYVEQ